MNIFSIAGELILLYLLYKFIFNFIVPVYIASQKVKSHFREMHQQQGQHINSEPETTHARKPSHDEEYIEYEEVK